jgi:hypothetical protein
MKPLDTHDVIMPSGKHRGERLTRVPVSYLRWMANSPAHSLRELAKAEIDRRGHALPTVELSGHAIDNASLRVRKIWHETKKADEGLYSWLMRMVVEAMASGAPVDGAYFHNGMKLVVQQGEEFPVLKTVMAKKPRRQEAA